MGILFFAFLLAAFLYLPLLFEQGYVQIFLTDAFLPQNHFVAWWQLFDPGWGLGFSMPGTAEDGMSFQLGVFHWLLLSVGVFFMTSDLRRAKKMEVTSYVGLGAMGIFLLSLFLQIDSPITHFLYDQFSMFKRQQFPWRFLNVSILAATFIGALALDRFKLSVVKIFLSCLGIFILSSYYLRPGVFIHLNDHELLTYDSDTTFSHEYTPVGRDTTAEKEYQMTEKIYSLDNRSITIVATNAHTFSFSVVPIDSVTAVRINSLYFPGMIVQADGDQITFKVLTKKDMTPVENRDVTGIVQLDIPPKISAIKIIYEPTNWRKIGSLVTLLSIGGLITYYFWITRRRDV